MPLHWQFGHLQPKLWAKEGPGVKLAVWLPTTKRRESMPSRHPIRVCDMELERSRRGLQLWFRPRRNPTLQSGVMAVQSFGSPRNLCHLDVVSTVSCREYYREWGGGLLPSPGHGESCMSKCPWQVPTPKGVPNAKLTSRGWFLDADSSLIF
jgi:hypothetical protein